MGWSYKDKATATLTVAGDTDEDIDTSTTWYKLISVPLNSTHSNNPLQVLEDRVNDFIANTVDEFVPSGPPQVIDGRVVQLLVDVDNLDNK